MTEVIPSQDSELLNGRAGLSDYDIVDLIFERYHPKYLILSNGCWYGDDNVVVVLRLYDVVELKVVAMEYDIFNSANYKDSIHALIDKFSDYWK